MALFSILPGTQICGKKRTPETENGKRKTENGKRKTENGKRKTENHPPHTWRSPPHGHAILAAASES
jgi:hypothetical protein